MVPSPAEPEDANPYAAPKARVQQPQAFDEERPLASRLSRLFAIILDSLLAMALLAALVIPMTKFSSAGEEAIAAIAMISVVPFMVLQFVLIWKRSQTLGKIIMKIRIDEYGSNRRAGPLKAIVLRSIVAGAISSIPIVGLLFTIINPLFIFGHERRCLHDHIAGTVVRVAP